jgi:small subunit ribosomal protein S17
VTEERENRQETETSLAKTETPEENIEGGLVEGETVEGEPVEAGLEPGAAKGPALDQDEGSIQEPESDRGSRKERVGIVVSDKPQKTVVVSVETLVRHPMYKKRVRRSKKFMVHDEQDSAKVGDTVRIIETRPLSARKRWRLGTIVSRAE